jgi:hypothetical protein
VARSSFPASENLHITGREQMQQHRDYSITSSARSRNDSGIVTPSALAVVRLMTRSLVDARFLCGLAGERQYRANGLVVEMRAVGPE